jgi:mannosyltransferase OCH1-like enzyme
MIPKIIHYCWLSGDPIPKDYQKRMRSWDKKLSGYELMLWDTSRFDINSLAWTKDAFAAKDYAFTSDYIRLYAVYHFGGIYLDMDVEAVKPFDDLLNTGIFLSIENHECSHLEAGCFGAEKGHRYIKKCLEWFETHAFGVPDYILPAVMYEVWKAYFNTIPLYSSDYFTAKSTLTGKIEKTANTYTIHHFATKWISAADRLERNIGQMLLRLFGENNVSHFLIKIVQKTRTVLHRVRNESLGNALKYYTRKYLLKKKGGTL